MLGECFPRCPPIFPGGEKPGGGVGTSPRGGEGGDPRGNSFAQRLVGPLRKKKCGATHGKGFLCAFVKRGPRGLSHLVGEKAFSGRPGPKRAGGYCGNSEYVLGPPPPCVGT